MRETDRHEIPKWLKMLGAWRINTDSIDFSWGYFAPRFGLELSLSKGGYFAKNWELDFCLIYGKFNIKLPFNSGLDTCSPPKYGVCIHNNTFWIYTGGPMDEGWNQCKQNWITWDLPYFSFIHDGHWIKGKDGNLVLMGKKDSPWEFRKTDAYTETHPYTYILRSGAIQQVNATIVQERRQWHKKWFPFIKTIRDTINIEFDQEVGEEAGSWKGGCTGCGYDMLPGETMLDTLRRMEVERKF